jgi:hypothetical protein
VTKREDVWSELAERGFVCVYDGEYGPDLNADAALLFTFYPRLMQKHLNGIWCHAPGMALIRAFRRARTHGCEARPATQRITAAFSEPSVIALVASVGVEGAARHIFDAAIEGAAELSLAATKQSWQQNGNDDRG